MRLLRKIISSYMYRITCILVTIILLTVLVVEVFLEQRKAYEDSLVVFSQIEQILDENTKELEEIQESYKVTCLRNAEVIARIIEGDISVLDDIDELKKIAETVEVDEIHIFNKDGKIITGTHPEYYGYTFDSGEQISFFKPLLKNKNLKLVQDITPNTAQKKLMQYSALWSKNGEFIVQVGMEPVNVTKVTKKNELSYIFSLFKVNVSYNYFAINAETGKIVGASDLDYVGKPSSDIGFDAAKVATDKDGFHASIDGVASFCLFEKKDDTYIGRTITISDLYRELPENLFVLAIALVVIACILVATVTTHMNKYVVNNIHLVNEKLDKLATGDVDERVDIKSSVEFFELSNYINVMVQSLLNNNEKMAYVLSKTKLYIGVYECKKQLGKVRCSGQIQKIFSLSEEGLNDLISSADKFREFIDRVKQNKVPNERHIYKLGDTNERYVKISETEDENEIFGVVVDVTDDMSKLKEVEAERDIDVLTGLYNRRGLETKVQNLLEDSKELKHSAVIMIDADGLKQVNDGYGHEMGDAYLKELSEVIKDFGAKGSIAARHGGDEFVLFLYGYDTEEDLIMTIDELKNLQNNNIARINDNLNVPLEFSLGYSIVTKNKDYQLMLLEADANMYKNKAKRKGRK